MRDDDQAGQDTRRSPTANRPSLDPAFVHLGPEDAAVLDRVAGPVRNLRIGSEVLMVLGALALGFRVFAELLHHPSPAQRFVLTSVLLVGLACFAVGYVAMHVWNVKMKRLLRVLSPEALASLTRQGVRLPR